MDVRRAEPTVLEYWLDRWQLSLDGAAFSTPGSLLPRS